MSEGRGVVSLSRKGCLSCSLARLLQAKMVYTVQLCKEILPLCVRHQPTFISALLPPAAAPDFSSYCYSSPHSCPIFIVVIFFFFIVIVLVGCR